jgi:hypothetical protein
LMIQSMKIYEGLFVLARFLVFIFVFIMSWRYVRNLLRKEDFKDFFPPSNIFLLYFLCFILASVISMGAVVLFGFILVVIGGLFDAIAG